MLAMLKLPYGISNFLKVAQEGYYFVDRTPYIAQLEQLPEPYLFFLRPRRFGKSLLFESHAFIGNFLLQVYFYVVNFPVCISLISDNSSRQSPPGITKQVHLPQ